MSNESEAATLLSRVSRKIHHSISSTPYFHFLLIICSYVKMAEEYDLPAGDFDFGEEKSQPTPDVSKLNVSKGMKRKLEAAGAMGGDEMESEAKRKSPEQIAIHQACVCSVLRYSGSRRFGDWLKQIGFGKNLSLKSLKAMPLCELEDLLVRLEVACASRQSSNQLESLVLGGVELAEVAIKKTRLPLYVTGTSAILRNDEHFLDLLECANLKYGSKMQGDIRTMLLMSILSAAGRVHAMNSVLINRAKIITANVNNDESATNERPPNEGGNLQRNGLGGDAVFATQRDGASVRSDDESSHG